MDVVLNELAERQLEDAYRWWADHRSADQATRWYNGFLNALSALEVNSDGSSLAPESSAFPCEIRELHFGIGSRPTHRALFTIRPDVVFVFSIRHLAQKPVTPDDL